MAQTILNEKQSTVGGPYAFYTVEVISSERTANSVNLVIIVKSHLQNSLSYLGTGVTITGYLTINNISYSIPLKASSVKWSGTTVYTANKNITVNGLSASATSITGVTFSVVNSYDNSSSLSNTSCSNITIPVGNSVSGFSLSHNPARLGDTVTTTINSVAPSHYHKIVATAKNNSYTFTTNARISIDLAFTASRFGSWFSITSKELKVTLTMTTYDLSGTSIGSVTQEITIIMTDELGKPSTPTAAISEETANGATILLTEPSTFKYGATFENWKVTANEGTVSVSGNTITATVDVNKTAIVSIQAVDSRGFESDVVNLAYHLRKRGFCIYKDGIWKPCKAIVYMNGAHTKTKNRIYNNGWKA